MATTPDNVLTIKELNVDMIPPVTAKMDDPDHGGSKIVVIGKPGTGNKGSTKKPTTGNQQKKSKGGGDESAILRWFSFIEKTFNMDI